MLRFFMIFSAIALATTSVADTNWDVRFSSFLAQMARAVDLGDDPPFLNVHESSDLYKDLLAVGRALFENEVKGIEHRRLDQKNLSARPDGALIPLFSTKREFSLFDIMGFFRAGVSGADVFDPDGHQVWLTLNNNRDIFILLSVWPGENFLGQYFDEDLSEIIGMTQAQLEMGIRDERRSLALSLAKALFGYFRQLERAEAVFVERSISKNSGAEHQDARKGYPYGAEAFSFYFRFLVLDMIREFVLLEARSENGPDLDQVNLDLAVVFQVVAEEYLNEINTPELAVFLKGEYESIVRTSTRVYQAAARQIPSIDEDHSFAQDCEDALMAISWGELD